MTILSLSSKLSTSSKYLSILNVLYSGGLIRSSAGGVLLIGTLSGLLPWYIDGILFIYPIILTLSPVYKSIVVLSNVILFGDKIRNVSILIGRLFKFTH